MGGERRERDLLVHKVACFGINVLLYPKLIFFDEIDSAL